MSANESRAYSKHKVGVTAASLKSLERYYRHENDRRDPELCRRKRKFASLVSDLFAQIAAARKMHPPPKPAKLEPPDEIVFRWLRDRFGDCELLSFRKLPSDVREDFLKEHPQWRNASGSASQRANPIDALPVRIRDSTLTLLNAVWISTHVKEKRER